MAVPNLGSSWSHNNGVLGAVGFVQATQDSRSDKRMADAGNVLEGAVEGCGVKVRTWSKRRLVIA